RGFLVPPHRPEHLPLAPRKIATTMRPMTTWQLKKLSSFHGPQWPVITCVMAGVGIGKQDESDAVFLARKPNLDWLQKNALATTLSAHGVAVGMPSDADMGNSEVGHNALGAGRIYDQGAKLVQGAVDDGSLFRGEARA